MVKLTSSTWRRWVFMKSVSKTSSICLPINAMFLNGLWRDYHQACGWMDDEYHKLTSWNIEDVRRKSQFKGQNCLRFQCSTSILREKSKITLRITNISNYCDLRVHSFHCVIIIEIFKVLLVLQLELVLPEWLPDIWVFLS